MNPWNFMRSCDPKWRISPSTKLCRGCGKHLPFDAFGKQYTAIGTQVERSRCKPCMALESRERNKRRRAA